MVCVYLAGDSGSCSLKLQVSMDFHSSEFAVQTLERHGDLKGPNSASGFVWSLVFVGWWDDIQKDASAKFAAHHIKSIKQTNVRSHQSTLNNSQGVLDMQLFHINISSAACWLNPVATSLYFGCGSSIASDAGCRGVDPLGRLWVNGSIKESVVEY